MSTSRVRLLPTGTGNMALKPPFSSLYYRSEVPGPEASTPVPWPLTISPPPRSSLPVGIGGWHHLGQSTLLGQRVTPLRWERLNLATPTHGDAHTCQRPHLATATPVDAHTWRSPHLATPTPGDAHTWRRPCLVTPKTVNLLTSSLGAPW